jgi:hypothetical protein
MSNMVPMAQLSVDLQNGDLPNYAMIVPNLAERRARLPARGGELLRRQQVCKY